MTIQKISKKVPTCSAILWTWTTNNDGKHPVKIRVTFNGKNKYYSAEYEGEKIWLTKEQWDASRKEHPRGENKTIKAAVDACESEARKAVRLTTINGRQFTFDRFESNYINKTISSGFIARFESYLNELLTEGRTGSYIAYKNALSAFKTFRNGAEINPAEINVQLLKSFEAWLRKKKTKVNEKTKKETVQVAGSTTVAMYMRSIKVVYNLMTDEFPELIQDYPFLRNRRDRNKYKIPKGSGESKGEKLSVQTLKTFMAAQTDDGTPQHAAKLCFMFSYFCQGMNLRDVANLRYKNIKPDAIRYVRAKTEKTTSGDKAVIIEIPRTKHLNKILKEITVDLYSDDDFVFPVLNHSMSPIEKDKAVRQFIKVTNKWIKAICNEVEIEPFTTYSARHTYATMLKQGGVPMELIKEQMGHGNIETTESYVPQYSLDKKREANESIFKLLTA